MTLRTPVPLLTKRYLLRGSHKLDFEPRLHGHDYRIEITVKGPLDPKCGWIFSRDGLDRIVKLHLIDPLDGKDWSRKFPFSSGEALRHYFFETLKASELGTHLVSLQMQETEKNRFP